MVSLLWWLWHLCAGSLYNLSSSPAWTKKASVVQIQFSNPSNTFQGQHWRRMLHLTYRMQCVYIHPTGAPLALLTGSLCHNVDDINWIYFFSCITFQWRTTFLVRWWSYFLMESNRGDMKASQPGELLIILLCIFYIQSLVLMGFKNAILNRNNSLQDWLWT